MPSEHNFQYKIFGISETDETLKIKSYGDFGSPTSAEWLSFPQFITPMKNERYLLHPQSWKQRGHQEKFSKIAVEEWQHNEDWNRSPFSFPENFFDESFNLWIFKV